MKLTKQVITDLPKNYALCPLTYQGKERFLLASELDDRCQLFDWDGTLTDTVWEHPGGVMSMVQVPGTDGQFLATLRFWGFNNASTACIAIVTPDGAGHWEQRVLCELPFVHRIDILEKNGLRWLIACQLKSGHEYDDDWRFPGKVLAAVLPEDLSGFSEENQLPLTVLTEGLFHNHGYTRLEREDGQACLVTADSGVYLYTPPETADGAWRIEQLISDPASDAALSDLDGDGEEELGLIAPFHGEKVRIYKKRNGVFEKVFEYGRDLPFLHAFYCGPLCGKNRLVVGNRSGEKELLAFTFDKTAGAWLAERLDLGRGPANALYHIENGKELLAVSNRETDEGAIYVFEP